MRYYLFLMIFSLISFNRVNFAYKSNEALIPVISQLGPIYFFYTVPSRIKLNDRVDLSFSKSSLINTYRYRLEIPEGGVTAIDKNVVLWSAWKTEDFTKIVIPGLDIAGAYRFIIEYKTGAGTETKKFEKVFEVYSVNPVADNIIT